MVFSNFPQKNDKRTEEDSISYRMMPGTRSVAVAPLICSAPMSGSMVRMKPAAPILCAVAATLEILAAASDSKSKEYVHMMSLPRAKDRMKGSSLWQLCSNPAVTFLRLTSAAAATGKCTPPKVGAADTGHLNNVHNHIIDYIFFIRIVKLTCVHTYKVILLNFLV